MDRTVKYGTRRWREKTIVTIEDPVFKTAMYLASYSAKKGYRWTTDALYARKYSTRTALIHKRHLEAGADKDWRAFSDQWLEYYLSAGVKY